MHISSSLEPKPLWEGMLESPAGTYRGVEGVSASIGEPFQWAQGELLGEKWKPPVGGNRFYLLQLAFTLSPRGSLRVTSAEFYLSLGEQDGQRAIIFDAYPREQLAETSLPVTLGIGPDFKLGAAEASLAKAETTIDFGYAIPIIRVEGLQEARLGWRYKTHPKHPLSGSRRMLAVVTLPPAMTTTLATFELMVSGESRFGPIRVATPEAGRARLRWVVGER